MGSSFGAKPRYVLHDIPLRTRWALVLLAAPLSLVMTGCVADTQSAESISGPSIAMTSPQVQATSAPLETTESATQAPVYWIGRSDDNTFLYREFRDVPEEENQVTRALRAMMSESPLDPDFFTPWQNPKKLATSISGRNVITVDVSDDAFNSTLDADMAARAVQQLVYTASAAGASSGLIDAGVAIQVVVLVDGHTDFMAFDHVKLGEPMSRNAALVAPVWIIDPQEGSALPNGSVKISGRSTTPGGLLSWQLLRKDEGGESTTYLSGETLAANTSENPGLFSLSLSLEPGSYDLRVSDVDPEDSGRQLHSDTRKFTVSD
ncbi:GerMN domain-containing protein [Pseudarthrobacter sp. PS3-L1]|uniref:GerMN domain-containing protein n=1 Tax=Pseudarthrobacter sp. PS3-L1 TaxID=3046207 RepID=UPI0024B92EFA|nr:GerMN domain-containing protein [Pseudarthrobacter sp. PS3-L1]MDJ0320098.1 GerMN domain-containing protein [Pseudarthrobacter sp. PS3-L1]